MLDDVHVHRVPIELSADFVEECNNMCNAFVFHMREAETHMHTVFDLVHVHDWLCAKAGLLKSVLSFEVSVEVRGHWLLSICVRVSSRRCGRMRAR